jgi:hypothetical protein
MSCPDTVKVGSYGLFGAANRHRVTGHAITEPGPRNVRNIRGTGRPDPPR